MPFSSYRAQCIASEADCASVLAVAVAVDTARRYALDGYGKMKD